MTPEERADKAQAILTDPLFRESIEKVRETYRDMIEQTPVSDDTALLDIRKMLHLLREVEQHLEQVLDNGKIVRFRTGEQERQSFLPEISKLWKSAQ